MYIRNLLIEHVFTMKKKFCVFIDLKEPLILLIETYYGFVKAL